MRLTIGVKLIGGLLLIFLFFIMLGTYALIVAQKLLQDRVGEDLAYLAQDQAARLDKEIFFRIEDIQLFAHDTLLRKTLRESNEEFEKQENVEEYIKQKDVEWTSAPKETVTSFMTGLIENDLSDVLRENFFVFFEQRYGHRVFGEAFVTNRYGANAAQTGKTSDYYQADEKWWQEAKEHGFSVGEMEYDESAQVWTLPFGVRVDDEDGNFLGVIKAIPLAGETIKEIEFTTRRYETTALKLLTEDGRLVYSSTPFQVLEDLSQESFFQKLTGARGFFTAKNGGEGKLFAYASSTGFRDFKGLGLFLVIEHEAKEVFAPVNELQWTFAMGVIMSFTAFAILTIVFTRTISGPLKKLMDAARHIAGGNLDVKIGSKSKDEIGQLAAAFNEMTDKLKESHRSLEGKVKERTEELEERIGELDKNAKLLARRDLELSETREHEQSQIRELDAFAKRLVRRDFELLQANETLREMDEAKSRFVSIAAHQLRTPLSGVKWALQMFLGGDFGRIAQKQKSILQEGLATLDRLIKLVGDLLNVARIESGQMAYRFAPFQIEDLCKKIFQESRAEARNRGIAMKLSLPQASLPSIYGDSSSVFMVLQNLIDNALVYTRKGGFVEVGVERDLRGVNSARVFVKDTGMGIPEFQKTLVGQKFFRGDNVVREQIPGTGLGLYIVTRILERHDSKLEVESQEGKGSTFSFALSFPKNSG